MKTVVALLCLSACRESPQDIRVRFHPQAVDQAYVLTVDQLADTVNELVGYDCLAFDAEYGKGQVVADNEFLNSMKATDPGMQVSGFTKGKQVTVRTPFGKMPETPLGTCVKLGTCNVATMFLAHEIGHALGLEHTYGFSGLMRLQGDLLCVGNEAACLVEALQEQGLVP